MPGEKKKVLKKPAKKQGKKLKEKQEKLFYFIFLI
jgi:hypothetical protein